LRVVATRSLRSRRSRRRAASGWSAPLDLELGRLHVAARRADQARALLQPLAADPHGGAIAENAKALLEELDPLREP
jgi:hypothetical protein